MAFDRHPENRNLQDPEEIERALKLGEYIRNGACSVSFWVSFLHRSIMHAAETLALYSLRKYRHLKRMYPEHSHSDVFP